MKKTKTILLISAFLLTLVLLNIKGMPKVTHRLSKSKQYRTWINIRVRCKNQKHNQFHDYGGRGITVCHEWDNSFEAFYEDMGPQPEGYTIERKDNEKGYYKENCRWATMYEQANNKRSNRVISFNGQSHTLSQWANISGIGRHALGKRISTGWSFKDAISYPVDLRKSHKIKINEHEKNIGSSPLPT